MADKRLIIREKVEHSGIFSFSGIYSTMHRWLKEDEGFLITEDKYSEKISGNARDIVIEWTVTKKISDYYAIEIKVKFDVSGLVDVDVEVDGKKERTNKGKMAIDFKGVLVIDPEGKWETTPFSRFMRDFYDKYVVPSRTESMREMVFKTVSDLVGVVKSILEMSGKQ